MQLHLAALAVLLFYLTTGQAFAADIPDQTGQERRFQPVGDLTNAVQVFSQDAWHIYTFPRHMDRSDWLILGGVLTATGLTYAYDDELREMFERNEDVGVLAPLREVGDFVEPAGHMGNTNVYYLGGLVVSYTAGWEQPTRIFAQILESHYIAGLGKNAIQYFVGRARPHQDLGPREFGLDDATSFPSGHASNIFQVAAVLSHHADRRWFSYAAYGVAGSVAVQRIRSSAHWPSDVVLSSFYGWSVAQAVLRRHECRLEGRRVTVAPHASQLGTGAQLVWRF